MHSAGVVSVLLRSAASDHAMLGSATLTLRRMPHAVPPRELRAGGASWCIRNLHAASAEAIFTEPGRHIHMQSAGVVPVLLRSAAGDHAMPGSSTL